MYVRQDVVFVQMLQDFVCQPTLFCDLRLQSSALFHPEHPLHSCHDHLPDLLPPSSVKKNFTAKNSGFRRVWNAAAAAASKCHELSSLLCIFLPLDEVHRRGFAMAR